MPTFNIYTDESCHLEHDGESCMVIGAVWCLKDRVPDISQRLADIKRKHGLHPRWELKWTKVSNSKIRVFQDVLDFFFDDDDLRFRAIVADKTELDHSKHKRSHDDWYYRVHFETIAWILDPSEKYNLYLDYRDTNTSARAETFRDYVCQQKFDFDRKSIERVQPVRSHESAVLQLADLLTGALAYSARGLDASKSKTTLVEQVKRRAGVSLESSTILGARKFNISFWIP